MNRFLGQSATSLNELIQHLLFEYSVSELHDQYVIYDLEFKFPISAVKNARKYSSFDRLGEHHYPYAGKTKPYLVVVTFQGRIVVSAANEYESISFDVELESGQSKLVHHQIESLKPEIDIEEAIRKFASQLDEFVMTKVNSKKN